MESIILNLLNLTGEERAAFAVLAPQRFHPDGAGLTVEDWQSAQVILGNPPPECLRGSTALRWLHTRSAGVDPYTAPGVLPSEAALTCSTGAYGHSVSEHLFALLLALMKRLPSYRDQQNRALWRDLGPVKTLLGAQVLVVGTGDLGSSFARLCQTLGASTSGVRRDPAKPAAGIERMYGFEALDTLLPAADVVALTLPQTPGTVRLFDKARLLRMKGDAILLNGGRGSCVDGQALAEVLADGRLWGAGLDVTDPEPLPPEHPLWRQPRALITPHTAGGNHLADTERRIARIALDNLRRYLAGEALRNRVRCNAPYRSCRRSSSGDRGERAAGGMSNTVLQPACPARPRRKAARAKAVRTQAVNSGLESSVSLNSTRARFCSCRPVRQPRQTTPPWGRPPWSRRAPPQRESAPWCRSRQSSGAW